MTKPEPLITPEMADAAGKGAIDHLDAIGQELCAATCAVIPAVKANDQKALYQAISSLISLIGNRAMNLSSAAEGLYEDEAEYMTPETAAKLREILDRVDEHIQKLVDMAEAKIVDKEPVMTVPYVPGGREVAN